MQLKNAIQRLNAVAQANGSPAKLDAAPTYNNLPAVWILEKAVEDFDINNENFLERIVVNADAATLPVLYRCVI